MQSSQIILIINNPIDLMIFANRIG